MHIADPAYLWPWHESRAVTFENPTGARGAGGVAAGGRKGAPNRVLAPGQRIVLADLEGPGRVTHVWLTVAPLRAIGNPPPEFLRAQVLTVTYDDRDEPSVSVPVPDFFGAVHGVAAPYASALTTVNEGRGFASRIPMPFPGGIRIEYENASDDPALLYYQVDVLLGPVEPDTGLLHVMFNRANPTSLGDDLVVLDGLRGPGRYLGTTGGVRPADPHWWGEGELKLYLDGETSPTICGTGTEDYLDSAWGIGRYHAPEAGAPLVLAPGGDAARGWSLVGWYRWHLSDPIVFSESVRVTLQQIGSVAFGPGQEEELAAFRAHAVTAGDGWLDGIPGIGSFTLYERSDDWCATGFAYCRDAQPVPPVDVTVATADVGSVPRGLARVQR